MNCDSHLTKIVNFAEQNFWPNGSTDMLNQKEQLNQVLYPIPTLASEKQVGF